MSGQGEIRLAGRDFSPRAHAVMACGAAAALLIAYAAAMKLIFG